jgi:hypothetical protein
VTYEEQENAQYVQNVKHHQIKLAMIIAWIVGVVNTIADM